MRLGHKVADVYKHDLDGVIDSEEEPERWMERLGSEVREGRYRLTEMNAVFADLLEDVGAYFPGNSVSRRGSSVQVAAVRFLVDSFHEFARDSHQ